MEGMDTESEIDSDEEAQLKDLAQLDAVLEEDDDPATFFPEPSTSGSLSTSHHSRSLPSTASIEAAFEQAKLDSALGLNKLLDEKLKRLEKVLVGRLHECRQKLTNLHNSSIPGEKPERNESFRYVNCGKPYFKDKSNFPAPDNEDTILMAKSNMYDFSEITSVPGWTVKDKSKFTKLLFKMSIEIRKDELKSKIAQLKREGKEKKPKYLEKEIDAINKEMMALTKKTLKEVALPIDQEYDWDIVANKLNKRHSAAEYRSLWKVFLHPDINKKVWTKSEHTLLHEIAQKHRFQDWKSIAKTLNTGRTGYQCFVYFRTNISNTFTGKKWTKEEEEYLRRLIEYYKEDEYIPWGKVATAMENRTKIQIYNKYFRLVERRKGRFLPEEDAVILTCIGKFGLNFKKMSEYLPGRSAAQIRVRYGVLAKKRISTVWTIEEDKQLLQLMSNEDTYSNYSSVTKHFPEKTRVQVRARYMTLLKWMKGHPNTSIENAPRRAARRLGHGLPTDNLNKATEKLKKRIESEIERRKIKRITNDSPLEVIEDAIIANLATELIKEEEARKAVVYDEEEVLVLNDEVVSAQSLNVTNLQKLIIYLRGKLNQGLFAQSSYADKYPELLKSKQEVNLFQVKSYSKKGPMTAVKVDGAPDIWGNNTLGPLTYVLPPHYATITGCRRLMAYVSAKQKKDAVAATPLNINMLMRSNPAFKSQLFLLMERFNILFMFPMLLSNEGPEQIGKLVPKENKVKSTDLKITEWNDKTKSADDVIPNNSAGYMIPKMTRELAQSAEEATSIDLEEPGPDQKKKTCLQKVAMGDNNFRYITEVKKNKVKRKYAYF